MEDSILNGPYVVEARSKGNFIFGSILKQLRLENGMTPEQLAGRVGISTPFVNGIERGAQAPSMETAKKLLSIITNERYQIVWVDNGPYDLMVRDLINDQEWQFVFKAEVRGQNRRPDRESEMHLMERFNIGPLVDGSCPNENCSEHMVAVRYPATIEYVNQQNISYAYFDLPMRCSTCGSLFPPANEGQLEEQIKTEKKVDPVMVITDAYVQRMREESGTVKSDDKLVLFLCLLARDWVPTGMIDQLIDYEMSKNGTFTNGWLAKWAEDAAGRLQGKTITNKSILTPTVDARSGDSHETD